MVLPPETRKFRLSSRFALSPKRARHFLPVETREKRHEFQFLPLSRVFGKNEVFTISIYY